MKLGICYNVFDEINLLESIINQIKDNVDYILINYQNQSYFGNKIDTFENDIVRLNNLVEKKLFNKINIFMIENPAITISEAKEIEKKKRNAGRLICLEKDCTHFLDSDCDEFYKKEEFKKAKQYIIENNIDFSGCHFYNYQNKPTFRSKKISKGIVPFICKLDYKYELTGAEFLGSCDPTRGYNIVDLPDFKKKLFFPYELMMHHMTGVRKDMYKKYKYTSLAALDKKRINEAVQTVLSIDESNLNINSDFSFIDKEYEIVENYFNIFL